MVHSIAELLSHDDEQFVRYAYQFILGRSPDPEGLGNYLELLRSGAPKQQIVRALSKSSEALKISKKNSAEYDTEFEQTEAVFTSEVNFDELMLLQDHRFIRAAYLGILRREADQEGLLVYLLQLRSGISKVRILKHIQSSKESRDRQAIINEWFRVVSSDSYPKGNAEAQEIEDNERGADLSVPPPLRTLLSYSRKEIISIVYRSILGRSPTIDELNLHLSNRNIEKSKNKILMSILVSKEIRDAQVFCRKVSQQIKKYNWGQLPFIGGIFRFITDAEGESANDRRLRRIENQLFFISENSSGGMLVPAFENISSRRLFNTLRLEAQVERGDQEQPQEGPVIIIRRSASTLLRTMTPKAEGSNAGRLK